MPSLVCLELSRVFLFCAKGAQPRLFPTFSRKQLYRSVTHKTNERINKVRACDEKLFFSLNIGNGLFAAANEYQGTLAISKRRLSAKEPCFAFFFTGEKEGRTPQSAKHSLQICPPRSRGYQAVNLFPY